MATEVTSIGGVVLETVCETCKGEGWSWSNCAEHTRKNGVLPQWREPCDNCFGTGLIVTNEGRILLEFIRREEDRQAAMRDEEERERRRSE